MPVFLFLYPIVEFMRTHLRDLADHGLTAERFDELIDLRYRKSGYQIAWLVFDLPGRFRGQPNLLQWSPVFHRHPEDLLLLSGITFEEMVKQRRHANPANVLRQLPERPARLVLGGFHQYDCVERVARFTHRSGIETWVDEDLTQFFFHQILQPGGIPTIRERIDWNYFHINPEDSWSVREFRQARHKRPWLTQL